MRRSVSVGSRLGTCGVVLLLLAGCGLPQPFRHDGPAPENNPLAAPRTGWGITIRPVVGAPLPSDRKIARAMAILLNDRDVPARTVLGSDRGPAGLVLLGWLLSQTEVEDQTRLALRWVLVDGKGQVLGETAHGAMVPTALWENADVAAADRIARTGLGPVMTLIQRDARASPPPGAPAEDPSPEDMVPEDMVPEDMAAGDRSAEAGPAAEGSPRSDGTDGLPASLGGKPAVPHRVASRPADTATLPPAQTVADLVMAPPEVTRAPGDGKAALEKALTRLFQQNGVRIVADAAPVHARLRGAVEVLPGEAPDREVVSIVWEVLSADGASLGKVNQRNAVARGALDGTWGDIAALIAEGAAMGMGEILVRKGIVAENGR